MSVNVIAPVLWDGFGNFINGAGIAIDSAAIVVGIVPKPTSIADQTPIPTLQVKDNRASNTYYLNWTLAQWQQAVGNTSTAPAVAGGGGGSFTVPPTQVVFGNTDSTPTSDIRLTYDPATGIFNIINIATGHSVFNIDPTDGVYLLGSDSGTRARADDVNKIFSATNAIAFPTMQVETGGGDVTIEDGNRGLYYDPPTDQATATITLPLSPIDGQEWEIWFGGTITDGTQPVIDSLTISPNGHTLVGVASIGAVNAGNVILVKYRADIDVYYKAITII